MPNSETRLEQRIESGEPITCEITDRSIKYYLSEESRVSLGVYSKPESIMVNGEKVTSFTYDAGRRVVSITLPAGEGIVAFN